jgi:hypothetical protein
VLQQVGVSFDLYYDARKHKIKISNIHRIDSKLPTESSSFSNIYISISSRTEGQRRRKRKAGNQQTQEN